MDEFEDSIEFEDTVGVSSDAFSPEKPTKKTAAAKKSTAAKPATTKKSTTAPKKPAAPKSDKPKAPAKPRAKKQKTENLDEGLSLEIDRSFDVLETPQALSDGPSPPRPAILQESNAAGPKKNASETYQKVPRFRCCC